MFKWCQHHDVQAVKLIADPLYRSSYHTIENRLAEKGQRASKHKDPQAEFHRKLDSGKFDVMRPRSATESLNSLHHRINDLQKLIQQGLLTTITRSEPSASVAQETAEHEAAFQRIVAEADACRASGERQCEP